jgi:hypothetical protein
LGAAAVRGRRNRQDVRHSAQAADADRCSRSIRRRRAGGLFGPANKDVVLPVNLRRTGSAQGIRREARKKNSVSLTRRRSGIPPRGQEEWPFPIPIVKRARNGRSTPGPAARRSLYRRIGANELDAIAICRGCVGAARIRAPEARGYDVISKQRIISSPANRMAWRGKNRMAHGTACRRGHRRAIEQGYTSRGSPITAIFKVLKGQGPAAPLGQMDFVVKDVMIGGFALAAAPAKYRVTGVMTFIVNHDGVVYQKDLGRATLDEFRKMERFNPDPSWTPVPEE